MKRAQLEHIIRAAAAISGDTDIVVIGSQAVHGQFADPPPELCVSDEADVYPRNHPERSDLVDGSIGELSPFHTTFGYYAQGVEPGTATLPSGWEARLVPLSTPGTLGATGWCLEIHDLLISKYVAGRDKDVEYCRAAVAAGMADGPTLRVRLAATDVHDALRTMAAGRIESDLRAAPSVRA